MSENQKTLSEEQAEPVQTAPEAEETEQSVLPAEPDRDEALEAADDTAADEPAEEEEDIDPADVRIFGMPRVCFHYTAFGVAIGYLVSGIIGIAGFNPPSATICAIVCAAIGYFIGNRLYKKRKAARDAAAQSPESAE